jgi:hypothetical protein
MIREILDGGIKGQTYSIDGKAKLSEIKSSLFSERKIINGQLTHTPSVVD